MNTHYILQTQRDINFVSALHGSTEKDNAFIADLLAQYKRQLATLQGK